MKIKKRYRYGFILLLLLAVFVLGGRALFLQTAKKKLSAKLKELNKAGFSIHYDTLYVNWRKNQISIEKINIQQNEYDTMCVYPEYFSAKKIVIHDFGILALVFSKEIDIDHIDIIEPRIQLRSGTRATKKKGDDKSDPPLPIRIGILETRNFVLEYVDSATCRVIRTYRSNFELHGLRIDMKDTANNVWDLERFRMSETNISQPDAPYDYEVRLVDYNPTVNELLIDTLKIIPKENKLNFGRKLGHDLDRIDGVIPFIRVKDFLIDRKDSLNIHASSIEVQFFLKIFHDKRLPHKRGERPLPVQALKQLPAGIDIDSVKVIKSYISYEEIPPEADDSGIIFFDNVYASIYDIKNDPAFSNNAMAMEAKADFMGNGKLRVKALLPWNEKQPNQLTGTLTDFHFEKVNNMLEAAGNIRAASGVMDKMQFNFLYNNTRSDGEVELNYHDLRIVTFRNDEELEKAKSKKRNRHKTDEELRKHQLKTFVLNAFILKKDMDESLPEEKRTGTVLFYRDQQRSLFNYWWKSILSGIKSAFKLDRLQPTPERK